MVAREVAYRAVAAWFLAARLRDQRADCRHVQLRYADVNAQGAGRRFKPADHRVVSCRVAWRGAGVGVGVARRTQCRHELTGVDVVSWAYRGTGVAVKLLLASMIYLVLRALRLPGETAIVFAKLGVPRIFSSMWSARCSS